MTKQKALQVHKPSKEEEAYLSSIYINSHSQNSVNCYTNGLNHARKFLDQRYHYSFIDLVNKIKNKELDEFKILNEFVAYLDKEGKKSSTIRTCLIAFKGFLFHCGIKIYPDDFKQSVKIPKKIRYREEPLTKEILVRVLRAVPMKLQTAILVATASGLRVGELVQLKIPDIDFE